MNEQRVLTPTQLDIHLDETVVSPQNYSIGAHWKVSRPVTIDAWRSAVHGMERVVRHLTEPLAAAFGVRPGASIAFDHVELPQDPGPELLQAKVRSIVLAPWNFAHGFIRVTVIEVAPADVWLDRKSVV